MKYAHYYAALILSFGLFFGCEFEKKFENTIVSGPNLPEKVNTAWEANYPGKPITGYAMTPSQEGNFKLESEADNVIYYLLVDSVGTVHGKMTEESISETALPAAALDTIRALYPDKEIVDCKRLTENEAVSFFANALIDDDGNWVEKEGFQFSPDGNIIERSSSNSSKSVTFRFRFSTR